MRRFIACLLAVVASCVCSQQLFAQFELPAEAIAPGATSRVGDITHTKAPIAGLRAPQLRKLSVPAAQTRSIATALSLRYRDLPGVKISPDVQNEHLVVMAPAQTQQKIANDLRQLLSAGVQKVAAETTGPLQIQLTHISWRTFERNLQSVAGMPLPITTNGVQRARFQLTEMPLQGTTIDVDRQANIVSVVAPDGSTDSWRQLIGALDQPPRRVGDITSLMGLGKAEPAPIQRAVHLLQTLKVPAEAVEVPQQKKSIFRKAVFQQDTGASDAGAPPAEGDGEAGSGVIGDAQIQFVPELGQIIIRGTKRDVERIKQVIKEIQEASNLTQPKIDVVQLNHADCNAVATLLQQLYDDVLSARQGDVSITSLDSPNALLLIGREEAIESLKELLAKIDLPVDPASRLRVFRLQNASAVDAEATIQGFFTNQPGSDDENRPGIGPRVRVLADYRTNSLIVSASPRDMGEVTRLVNELDVQQIEATNEIKIFPLSNASAEDLVTTLDTAINGGDDGGNDNVTSPSTSLSIVAVDSASQEIVNSGILAGATVTADTGANAIVVRAPGASMPLIAELIRQLDKAPGIDSLVKVFTIENGDAAQLTTALETLFGSDAGTTGTSIGGANGAGLPPATASGDSSLVPLRFSPDIRTNSIIASGSAADLEVVESILLRLDSEGFAERITEVVWLRHSDALAVSTALTTYVDERSQSTQQIQQFQQGLGPFDLPDRDLIVVPEIDSNSLLLSVSPRLYEDVRRLIDRLDRRRPMVMIKVMLAEINLSDTIEVGAELGLQDSLVFNRGLAVGSIPGTGTAAGVPGFNFNNAGVNNVNTIARDTVAAGGLSSFGLGTSSVGYSGFVLNAASESVSLFLRTLHDASRLQILSRPQVMAMDNTEALVNVGSLVARVTGINVTNNNSQTITQDVQTGLTLRVTPRVGADGLITMNIDATRSARDPVNGTPILDGNGNAVIIQDITQTTAQSTLSAFSGQTVVFGGLIQKTRTNRARRVPVVSDIPILGNLFRFDTEFEQRSELLIVMTPMLVTGEQDLEYIKKTESSRMSWCLADVVEAHGDVGLSGGYGLWGPAVGQTIYPDLNPTVENEVVVSDVPTHNIQHPESINAAPVEGPVYTDPTFSPTPAPTYQRAPVETFPAPMHQSIPVETLPTPAAPSILPTPAQGFPPGATSGTNLEPASIQQASHQNATTARETTTRAAFAAPSQDVKSSGVKNIPSSWLDRQNTSTIKPKRLGTTSSPTTFKGKQPTATKASAPASDDDSFGLLPSISPRAWIR